MPKKLKELADLNIGLRHHLVLEALEKYGLSSISQVVEYVCDKANISKVKKNVFSSLKKTIENDLKSFSGSDGVLGIKYYRRDGVTEVSLEDIEENKDGSIKNKYSIKYYIIGGNFHIPGAALLSSVNASFIPQKIKSILWKIEEVPSDNQKGRIGIILDTHDSKFISIHFNGDDVEVNIAISRTKESLESFTFNEKYGKRCSFLSFKNQSISRAVENTRDFHALIKFRADKKISIKDSSTNGTFFVPVDCGREAGV